MIKKLVALSVVSIALTACVDPASRSMGASLMPAPLTHRASVENVKQEMSLSATGFWAQNSDGENIKDMNAGGGNLSFTYRFANPVFFNVAAGAFAGTTKFGCNSDSDCRDNAESKPYKDWLKTKQGKDDYKFGAFQERILAGLDFNLGSYLFLGLAGGVQLYQGVSDYDDMREILADKGMVNKVDNDYDFAPTTAVWVGTRMGKNGQYGNVNVEYNQLYKGNLDEWNNSVKLTYAHPTGFFGGASYGNIVKTTVFVGKEFIF